MQKTICSIFFQPLKANRPFAKRPDGGYNSRFTIAAAEPGEYQTLVVNDVHEMQSNGSQQRFQTPVFADALAADLVSQWRDNKIAGEYGRPGVFVCAGDAPTPEELTRERFIQDTWCEKLCNEAESHWVKGDRGLVSELHRSAAKYLGRESYEWVHAVGMVKLVACPICAVKVDSTAIICKECGNPIDLDRWIQYQHRRSEAEAKLAELKAKIAISAPPPPAIPAPPPPVNANARR